MIRLLFFCFLLFVSCKTTYRRIDLGNITESEKQKVYNFGKRILETCKTRQFVQLSEREVTQGLAKLSLSEMQHACDVLDERNGKFIDMELVEVVDDTYVNGTKIYRYKANFERNDFVNEVRIWLKNDGKFAGIIWREWKDEYVPYK
ncbi:hypothetical protein [Flavobacterium sp.]|uniref:hypothetical protein n=1 Tax=Flavobacterium sp. TaxID=239 RepID=UPI0028BDEB5A|nr:hypothetical protein [Flavobacterium sp.]